MASLLFLDGSMERKLSTILALDVVGFSALMANDEDITLANLRQRRELIDGIIHEYDGRIFGSAGDSIIAEFSSPVKATECGVKIQTKMQAINDNLPENQKMRFRVGVNIGDVMISDNNLYGDAVNVAARLEAQADPEGVCVSKAVFDMVNQKIKMSFEPKGALELKNIDTPIEAFFVIPFKGGGRFFQSSQEPQLKVEKADAGSLAVMMFKSLSNDEEQRYFCEGFSEDLISALSRFKKLLVVSASASFVYRDKTKTPKEIGRELGVRYILEGSVRKLGAKMRITASLISCERENTIWSNNFDTSIDEIFDVQDEMIETIISTIVGRVEADEIQQISNARPENLAAYELVLQGLEFHRRSGITKDNATKAFNLFDQACELDPNYARAHAWRACSLSNYQTWAPEEVSEDWFADCNSSVTRALEIDSNDPEAHRIMGAIKLRSKDYQSVRYHHEKARSLCPSDPYISAKYATALIFLGEPEAALKEIERAMRLDPFCPDILFEDEGIIHFCLENFREAVDSFKKLKAPTINSLFYLSATFQKLERMEDAASTLSQAIAHSGINVEQFVETQHYEDQEKSKNLRNVLNAIN